MPLDILTYSKQGKRIGIYQFDEQLHHFIFTSNTIDPNKYHALNQIKDYYKTNLTLKETELKSFIHNLEEIQRTLPTNHLQKLNTIIAEISSEQVYKVRITGD